MSHDLVLFDLDGTLVDSLPDIAAALNHALRERGLAELSTAVVRTLVGDGVEVLAERALARQDAASVAPAVLAREVVAHYEAHPCTDTVTYPGIRQMLVALRGRGTRLAVLTNKPGGVARALLAALPIGPLFDAVVGDGDGWPRKPAPEGALALMQRFGATPDRTLMVGDGLPDLAVARAAGCQVAAAAWGYTPRERLAADRPDHLIAHPDQLLAIT